MTATRNAAATLAATLASVRAQRGVRCEHVIVDGGSTDGTVELVRAAPGAVRLVREPDDGIYEAFNKGLALARGELVAFLGGDDVYADDGVLARAVAAAGRWPEVGVFHGDLLRVNARGEVVSRHRFYPKWPIDSARNAENYAGTWIRQVYQPCSVVRRSVFERIGGFDASYRIAGDAEFFIRAREAGVRFRYLPGSPWVRMRDDGLSSRRHWQAELETLRAFRRHDPSRWRPYAQFVRARMVAFCEVRAPRALDLARRALGSPRSAGAAATDNAGREPLGCG